MRDVLLRIGDRQSELGYVNPTVLERSRISGGRRSKARKPLGSVVRRDVLCTDTLALPVLGDQLDNTAVGVGSYARQGRLYPNQPNKLGQKKNGTCQIDRTRMSLRTTRVVVSIVALRGRAGTDNRLQGVKSESLRTKEEGALSEKSTRNGRDYAAKPNTVPHHSAFRLKVQYWPCKSAQVQ